MTLFNLSLTNNSFSSPLLGFFHKSSQPKDEFLYRREFGPFVQKYILREVSNFYLTSAKFSTCALQNRHSTVNHFQSAKSQKRIFIFTFKSITVKFWNGNLPYSFLMFSSYHLLLDANCFFFSLKSVSLCDELTTKMNSALHRSKK